MKNVNKNECDSTTITVGKSKRHSTRVRVGDDDFEPPDGGWGWMICFACGFSNLCLYPVLQQFGLLFRDKFTNLGINASQISTIINTNTGLTSLMGLMNGPLFRAFSYRQVAIVGSLISTISIAVLSMSYTFTEYIVVYSVFYGIGMGFATPANALALNTYFDKKRRIATGFSWSATALGAVVMPHLISVLLVVYGVEGTTLIFAGIAANSIVAGCLLHPVHWHTKYRTQVESNCMESAVKLLDQSDEKKQTTLNLSPERLHKSASFISAQYVFSENDPTTPGYEIIDPGTPMLCHGNDGLFTPTKRSVYGSKQSLASLTKRSSTANYFEIDSKRASTQNLSTLSRNYSASNMLSVYNKTSLLSSSDLKKEKRKLSNVKNPKIDENTDGEINASEQTNGHIGNKIEEDIKSPNSGVVLQKACEKLEQLVVEQENLQSVKDNLLEKDKQDDECCTSCWQKVVQFFDLDLLKDPIYVNIMIGVTLAWFAELNFSILTPFVLRDFGFSNEETAMFMSIVGSVDIFVRFFIPFASAKVDWDNRTFFLIGIMCMAVGRIFLCSTQTYVISLPIAALIGFGKGLRTIFMALAIPSHVPLIRLPAATGLQLLTGGFMCLSCGPIVGWIRDQTESYVLTLHFLNLLTFTTTICWTLEKYIIKRLEQKTRS